MGPHIEVNSATDVLLILMYSPGKTSKIAEPIRGSTRLEKLMFLISEETSFKNIINTNYKFDAYDYGPFSSEIFDDLVALKTSNILEEIQESEHIGTRLEYIDNSENESNVYDAISGDRTVSTYQLTDKGKVIGKILFDTLSEDKKNEIVNIKRNFNHLPINNLLLYIYKKYPQVTKKSVIKEKIMNY